MGDKVVKVGKNKHIPSGERKIILRVLNFFEGEKRKGLFVLPVDQALKRTCAATGVSMSTITRIKREEKKKSQKSSPSPVSNSQEPEASPSSSPTAAQSPVVKRKLKKLPAK